MGGNDKAVETNKKKYGADHYSRIAKMRKSIPGGSFKGNPEFAKAMSLKAVAARKAKQDKNNVLE